MFFIGILLIREATLIQLQENKMKKQEHIMKK